MSAFEALSLIVAVISALIALRALYLSRMANEKANEIQAGLLAIEEAREKDRQAEKLRANLKCELLADRSYFRLTNNGPGIAAEIRAEATCVAEIEIIPSEMRKGSVINIPHYGDVTYSPERRYLRIFWEHPNRKSDEVTVYVE